MCWLRQDVSLDNSRFGAQQVVQNMPFVMCHTDKGNFIDAQA